MAVRGSDNLEKRLQPYLEALDQLKEGENELDLNPSGDSLDCLGEAILVLSDQLKKRKEEERQLLALTANINAGLLLDDVLENLYRDFHSVIPYNRIGFSLIEEDEKVVRAYWARSDLPAAYITKGYESPLEGSSLEGILATRKPRILNDLLAYLKEKPGSESTRMIVAEGIRSSLTCPLISNGKPVGFLFFSSTRPYTYEKAHVEFFMRIAGALATMVEKGLLVSELVEQKAAIETKNEELKRLHDLKNSFLGMAAHDLRSPLGTISVMTEILLHSSHKLPPDEREQIMVDYLNRIKRKTSHMLLLLDDLLDVAQIESGKVGLNLSLLNLKSFLEERVAEHTQVASSKNIRLILKESPPAQVKADAIRLQQVLDNLISNALKFSPPEKRVWLWLEQIPFGWKICVKDEGPGISEEDRERLFQDFARLSAKPTGGEKSTGLGLAIARRLIVAHGGHIGVDSEPGEGASFWFTLPG